MNKDEIKVGATVKVLESYGSSEHHGLFATICGRKEDNGFVPVANKNFACIVDSRCIDDWSIDPVFEGMKFIRISLLDLEIIDNKVCQQCGTARTRHVSAMILADDLKCWSCIK